MPRVLVVDDEKAIADTLMFAIERDCMEAVYVSLGGAALKALADDAFDLVILDVGLPDMTGFDVCRQLRKVSQIPVLFLTARDDEIDRVLGLEMGGDDYVTKPFSPREVVARIRAILKRTGAGGMVVETPPFHFDPVARVLSVMNNRLELTAAELRLAEALTRAPGRILSRQQILDAIGASEDVGDRSIDTHIKTLRRKLRDAGGGDWIRTHRGLGYSLELP